jgi:hypothetical protein
MSNLQVNQDGSAFRREEHQHIRMTTISEDADSDEEEMEFSTMGNQVKVELSWDETSVDFGP